MADWQGSASVKDMDKTVGSKQLPQKTCFPHAAAESTVIQHLPTKNSRLNMSSSTSSHDMNGEERDLTIEDIVELGDDSLGLRVLVTAKQGLCLRVVNIVMTSRRKLYLEKTSNPVTGRKKIGLRIFLFSDIISIKVLGEDREARQRLLKDAYCEKHQGKKILRKRMLNANLQEQCRDNSLDEELFSGWIQNMIVSEATLKDKPSPALPPPPPKGRIPRPSKWVIIDIIDDAYKKALSLINKETVISVGMAGLGQGRSGTLVWLTVAISSTVFLFDAARIGTQELMQGGLGEVLQDKAVVKVVHDCRAMEDLFHHQLNINLINVFDTQVAEIYLHMLNHHGAVPQLVKSLPSLLAHYLNLASHHIFLESTEYCQNEEFIWLERPLGEPLEELLAWNVMYLREVRLEQLDMMLVDLRQVTQLYLASMRDKDFLTISSMEPQVVPAEVQRLSRHSVMNGSGGHMPLIQYSKGIPRSGPFSIF